MAEDDTFRILKRDSFDTIINRIAAKSNIEPRKFQKYLVSIILNGCNPNDYFNSVWQGWTFEEVMQEAIKRKENDN